MAAGYSRVQIFSPLGIPLCDLDVATKRGWVLNDVGRCVFTVNIYDAFTGGYNAKATGVNLAYGNLVLIRHKPSVNQDGSTNGQLPPWVGVITPPRLWDFGKIQVTVMSAEEVLHLRATPLDLTATGAPGQIFTQIIAWANDQSFNPGAYPIKLGTVDMSGAHSSQTMKVSALEEIKTLYKASNYEWDVQPYLDSTNRLSLIANWYYKKGIPAGRYFTNVNMTAATPLLAEQGNYYNTVRSFSQASSTGNRNFALVQDAASVAANGVSNSNQVWPGTDGAVSAAGYEVVYQKGSSFIQQNKQPVRTFAPQVLDIGNDFSFLALGNTWNVQTDAVGFLPNGQIGTNGTVRLTAIEYDDLNNTALIAGVLQ